MLPVKKQVNLFLLALMFLTRLPVGRWVHYDPVFLAESTVYFPLVGALVGLLGALTLWSASLVLPLSLAVLLSMLVTVLTTGAFHEDGLADSVDGLGGSLDKTRALDIMRDSRIGTFGALALWFALMAKFLLLLQLAEASVWAAQLALVIGHTAGRWSSLWLIWRLEYVRTESATAKPFAQSVTPKRFWIGTVLFSLTGFLCFQLYTLVLLGLSLLVSFLAERFLQRRLGGITGDTLGAVNQVTEISLYFGLEVLIRFQNLAFEWSFS